MLCFDLKMHGRGKGFNTMNIELFCWRISICIINKNKIIRTWDCAISDLHTAVNMCRLFGTLHCE